jgi:hypothetical protein
MEKLEEDLQVRFTIRIVSIIKIIRINKIVVFFDLNFFVFLYFFYKVLFYLIDIKENKNISKIILFQLKIK